MSAGQQKERRFRMLDGPSIPWSTAEVIYAGHAALNGTAQSLEQLAQCGGFAWEEVGAMYRNKQARAAMDRVEALKHGR